MKKKQTNNINETCVYLEIHGDEHGVLCGYNKLTVITEKKSEFKAYQKLTYSNLRLLHSSTVHFKRGAINRIF